MLLLSTKKTGNPNASFIGIKFKYKIYRHKRSIINFVQDNMLLLSPKNCQKLNLKSLLDFLFEMLIFANSF